MGSRGNIFVLSAPSGAGKTSIIQGLRARFPEFVYSVSHTTRPPRPGEQEGRDYYFVSPETFHRMVAAGQFLEWARVYGADYGTSLLPLEAPLAAGQDVLLDVDPQGARNVRRRFPDSVLIFILPPSVAALEERLRARGTDADQTIAARMEEALDSIRQAIDYDYLVINADLPQAVEEVTLVVRATGLRLSRRRPQLERLLANGGPPRHPWPAP